jgi:peptidoglycan/xylan/chitin deacetylase (PgdA/CDA1 family)
MKALPAGSELGLAAARLVGATVAVAVVVLSVAGAPKAATAQVPILVYHRFGPVVADSMTVRTSTFRSQLQYLEEHEYHAIPLRLLIAHFRDSATLPSRPIVITVDDGHRSVVTEMLPLVREHGTPVTLFIYPSAISNASYAMTWEQLATLAGSGLFAIQSHTFWHPRFDLEKQRLAPADYREFVTMQLVRPRSAIKERLGVNADLISWPFGITDDELLQMAAECGYVAGVTLGERPPLPPTR